MKKFLLFISIAVLGFNVSAENPAYKITLSEMSFTEGTVYISLADGDDEILRVAIEVTDDSICVPVDFSKSIGKEISVQAFQDLNEDRQLNFDNYGRPVEPCLRTIIVPQEDIKSYELKLLSY